MYFCLIVGGSILAVTLAVIGITKVIRKKKPNRAIFGTEIRQYQYEHMSKMACSTPK